MGEINIASIIAACIVSAGGIGGIMIAVVKFCSGMIADRLSKKYEDKLQKEMERYKTELSKKEYVSKTRFDTEFGIYRELSASFFTMAKDISTLIPSGFSYQPDFEDEEERDKYEHSCYLTAQTSVVAAQDSLYASAAFIPEDFFKGYEEVLQLSKMQLNVFAYRFDVLSLETKDKQRELSPEDYKRTKEIVDKLMEHNSRIRDYLSSLDVF